MKKRDLLRLIESENKKRKNLNEDFYYDEMDEDFDMMSKYEGEPNWYEEDEEDYEEYEMSPGREEPGIAPGREDDEAPRPRNKMSRLSRRMNDPAVIPIRIDPDRKKDPKRKKDPDEWEWNEPDNPEKEQELEPQAPGEIDIMGRIREEFNRNLNRLDNVKHRPINYKKF